MRVKKKSKHVEIKCALHFCYIQENVQIKFINSSLLLVKSPNIYLVGRGMPVPARVRFSVGLFSLSQVLSL
jgi:hypothetical protein